MLAGGDKTHGHGASFADLDRNFHTDLLINPGGFALCDTLLVNSWSRSGYKCEARGEVGVCDSREMPVAFMRSSGRRDPDAQIILTKEQALVELRGIYSTHNPDKLQGSEVCASSSNRNFKGRQGSPTGRTLLMSPAMVAAAAVAGEVTDVRSLLN